MEHIFFHHQGIEHTIYEVLTIDEIKALTTMERERDRKLDPLNKKSVKKYFEETDRMVVSILRKCFHMSDDEIARMDETYRRNLAHSFIRFIGASNGLSL